MPSPARTGAVMPDTWLSPAPIDDEDEQPGQKGYRALPQPASEGEWTRMAALRWLIAAKCVWQGPTCCGEPQIWKGSQLTLG